MSITDHIAAIDSRLGDLSFRAAKTFWVAQNGLVGGSGSYSAPVASVGLALSLSAAGDTIIILPGVYQSENITINKNITLQGFGFVELDNSSIEVTTAAHFNMDNVNVNNLAGPSLTITNGSFNIINSNLLGDTATDTILINDLTVDSQMTNTNWQGQLHNANTTSYELVVFGVNDPQASLIADNNSTTVIRDSSSIGHISHLAGNLELVNVGQIVKNSFGDSIDSSATAPNSFLLLNLISTLQDNGTYGKINKTGNCDYKLGFNDTGSNDTYCGTDNSVKVLSDQIEVTYIPTSYSSDGILTDHIQQIDQMLGHALIRPSRLYYIEDVNTLNSIYSSVTETTFGYDTTIFITPGSITQFILNMDFKPGINLIGTGSNENVFVQMPNNIPNLNITSATDGIIHKTVWRDITLNSPVNVVPSLSGDEIRFENMVINGNVSISSGYMIIRDSKINGNITVTGGRLDIWNSEILKLVTIGAGEVYLNGVQQHVSNSTPSIQVSGGFVQIDNLQAGNIQESILFITGGKIIINSLIVDSTTYPQVITQQVGGSVYLGLNNIRAESKTISGVIIPLGVGY